MGKIKHGMTKTGVYRIWNNMMRRCWDPKHNKYFTYGGRGIMVCDRWLQFENFFEDMGHRPDGLTLERKDSNLDYTPENCRWASYAEQARNRRTNVMITLRDGRVMCMEDAAKEIGIGPSGVYYRMKKYGSPYLPETTKALGSGEEQNG